MNRLDSTLYTHKLPNGLQMLGQKMPGVESVGVAYWVCTGARDEQDEHSGVSHFLEHMVFKRTKTRTYDEVNREFEEMGAENNAFTWLEMTAFFARVLRENLSWAIELLTELMEPMLDAQDFDQERNVILEEIALYQDRPHYLLLEKLLADIFKDQPLGRPTLGIPETIKALRVTDMQNYWERRYRADNILMAIAGNFDWDTVVDQVTTLTADWRTGAEPRAKAEPKYGPRTDIRTNERWKQEQLALAVPCISRGDSRYYAAAVLSTILGDDTGSRLFWSVQQKGLAESVEAQAMVFDDAGTLIVTATTDPEHAPETLGVIKRELEQLQTVDISEDELERAKIKLMASVVIGGESTRERMMGLIESWLAHGRLETLEDIRNAINGVTIDDIQSLVTDYPLTQNQVLAALGPLPESALLAGA